MAKASSLFRSRNAVGAILLASGLVGLYCLVVTVSRAQDKASKVETAQALHRSNAVSRRSRRRSQLRSDPDDHHVVIDQALQHLKERNDEGTRGYGSYSLHISSQSDNLLRFDHLPLLPRYLGELHQEVSVQLSSDDEAEQERYNIHRAFVEAWFREECPPNIIWDDRNVHEVHRDLLRYGILEPVIRQCLAARTEAEAGGSTWSPFESAMLAGNGRLTHPGGRSVQTDGAAEANTIDGRETVADDDGALSFDRDDEDLGYDGRSQNMYGLLYKISEESARNEHFIHRGIQCSTCGVNPIQGIRYKCSNCPDFDFCEICESTQVHAKHHVFYKIRIPAPPRGRIKQITPSLYPGDPSQFKYASLPKHIAARLAERTKMDKPELDALYDQFRCLAGKRWPTDPLELEVAIDRIGFDKFFTSLTTAPNLIYDRLFAFYDSNSDGLIGFEEFLQGILAMQNKSRHAKLKRIFEGYDIDGDGFVDRKDFLRMLRAHYALFNELSREMVTNQDDESGEDNPRTMIESSVPISTIFPHGNITSHASRSGLGKTLDANGDMVVYDGNETLQEDLPAYGDRSEAIGNAGTRMQRFSQPFRSFRTPPADDEPLISLGSFRSYPMLHPEDAEDWEVEGDDPTLHIYGWPPLNPIHTQDVVNALGQAIAVEDIMDPVDRSRVIYAQAQRLDVESDQLLQTAKNAAVEERWRRKQFYTDFEEGMSAPPGYKENDSSDDEDGKSDSKPTATSDQQPSSRRQSMRSRSSSKVRFEENVTDTDYETRSNASSRGISVGERWGGFEISEAEKDVGKEILFQAVEQGFNELLDPLFKKKEDQAMEALSTVPDRAKWQSKLREFEKKDLANNERKAEALRDADLLRTKELLDGGLTETHDATSFARRVESSELTQRESGEPGEHPSPEDMQSLAAKYGSREAAVDQLAEDLMASMENKDASNPGNPDEPSDETLALWLRHEQIGAEAKERGGYGKLDFQEFDVRMVEDDEVGAALGEEDDGVDPEKKWNKTASIGRLEFVGSWLEHGCF